MNFLPTDLPGVILIEPDVYKDARGFFLETYHERKYAEGGIPGPFVQDNHSYSGRGTLRGLHAQLKHPQGKLVRAVEGEMFDVAVDIRPGSPSFGKWVGFVLSGENFRQLWIPPGFAPGFCVTSERVHVEYKCTVFYDRSDEVAIAWNDAAIGILWPIAHPTLSAKDQAAPRLAEMVDRLPADARGGAWPRAGLGDETARAGVGVRAHGADSRAASRATAKVPDSSKSAPTPNVLVPTRRSRSADATPATSSAFQLHCGDAGSWLDTATFPWRDVVGGGPHTVYGFAFNDPPPQPLFDASPGTEFVIQASAEVPWFRTTVPAATLSTPGPIGQVNLFAYFRDRRSAKVFGLVLGLFDSRYGATGTYEAYVSHDTYTPFVSQPLGEPRPT